MSIQTQILYSTIPARELLFSKNTQLLNKLRKTNNSSENIISMMLSYLNKLHYNTSSDDIIVTAQLTDVVGWSLLQRSPAFDTNILDVYVTQQHRRRGIGQRLAQTALSMWRGHGTVIVKPWTFAGDRFYAGVVRHNSNVSVQSVR